LSKDRESTAVGTWEQSSSDSASSKWYNIVSTTLLVCCNTDYNNGTGPKKVNSEGKSGSGKIPGCIDINNVAIERRHAEIKCRKGEN